MSMHAIHRLRERHSLDLAKDEFAEIAMRLSGPERNDPMLFRFVTYTRGFLPVWQVNLEPYHGTMLWVTVIYSFASRKVVTVLPIPVNSTIDEAIKNIRTYQATRQFQKRNRRFQKQHQHSVEFRSQMAIGA